VAAPPLDDEDEPSRRLGGALDGAVTALCCALALFAVKQVFRPAGNGIQYYLSLFLAGALPLTFLLVPGAAADPRTPPPGSSERVRLGARGRRRRRALYPVVTAFDAVLDRQGLPSPADDHRSDVEAASPPAKDIRIDTATQTRPVPLNAGAETALNALAG
jgi:hypothetical protein